MSDRRTATRVGFLERAGSCSPDARQKKRQTAKGDFAVFSHPAAKAINEAQIVRPHELQDHSGALQ
jgi:hypothetical protein